MRKLLARLTRMLGLIEFDLIAVTRPIYPDIVTLQHDEMIIVGDTKIRNGPAFSALAAAGLPSPFRSIQIAALAGLFRPTSGIGPRCHQACIS